MGGHYQWQGERLVLLLRVQPRASRDGIIGPHGEEALRVRITAPPVEGKANEHLQRFIAKAFGVPRSQVTLLSGEGSRLKRLAIDSPTHIPESAQIARHSTTVPK